VTAEPLGTTFTYQGWLQDDAGPVNDPALPMSFNLYDAAEAGNLVAGPNDADAEVVRGLFAVDLDFGAAAFDGQRRWLEITVNGATLSPRQEMVTAPYSMQTRGLYVSGDGSVGIGTTNPTALLNVDGNIRVSEDSALLFRGDANHGIGFKFDFGGIENDGPAVYGFTSGILGTYDFGNERAVLKWQPGNVNLFGNDTLEFGSNIEGKQVDAGKIGYQTFTDGLDIFGAGTTNDDRQITLWGEGGITARGNVDIVDGAAIAVGGLGDSSINHGLRFGGSVSGEGISSNRQFGSGTNTTGLDFYTSFSPRLSITNDGNVGIGTTTPNVSLDVAGGIRARGDNGYTFSFPGDDDSGMTSTADNTLQFLTNGAERVRIFDNKVGIGTPNPGALLHVNGGLADVGIFSGDLGPFGHAAIETNLSEPATHLWCAEDGQLVFNVTNGGNVFTSANVSAQGELNGGGTGHLGLGLVVGLSENTTSTGSLSPFHSLIFGNPGGGEGIDSNRNPASDQNRYGLDFYTSYAKQMSITNGGNVGIGTITPESRLHVIGDVKANSFITTGGSDVAEPYDIADAVGATPEAGMIVSIDPQQIGKMRISESAYDRTVAGIISGANGINPGILLQQEGTLADGKWPVAGAGRVWCLCDADANGPIVAGDMITSSSTVGHGMRADSARATGCVVGKAMSSLSKGRGLVLVLVSLQ
jgi:hypothetical protein